MNDAESIKEGINRVDDQQKEVVGASNGKIIVQKRRAPRAPSIAAASINDFGIACKPATKNRKL